MATYNGAKYIEEMLKSLADQTYKDFTCYIHDDGSTDGTMDVVKKFISEHEKTDSKTNFVILEHEPLFSARDNFLWMLKSVDADYYMFTDQDDVWVDDKIEVTLKKMKETQTKYPNDRYYCIFSDLYVVDENLNMIDESFYRYIKRNPYDRRYQRILVNNMVAGCTMLINKGLRDLAIRPVDQTLLEMHDSYIAAIASIMGQLVYIDRPQLYYRQHYDNVRGAFRENMGTRIKRNIKELITGEFLKAKKAYRQYGKDMAKALLQNGIEYPKEVKEVLKGLSEIDNKNKLYRMWFYYKHGFNKERHNFWYLLWV